MTDPLGVLGVVVVVFASTNLDDVILLAAFFADRHLRARAVVLGQFLGIGGLVGASAAAAWASLAVPEGYPALLGTVPLALGLPSFGGFAGLAVRRTRATMTCGALRSAQSAGPTRRCWPLPG